MYHRQAETQNLFHHIMHKFVFYAHEKFEFDSLYDEGSSGRNLFTIHK